MQILVGTSGYAYKEWRGSFYPEKMKEKDMLRYYAERFPAVEINNTFYRLPGREMLVRWAEEVPPGFVFVLKASQRITHRQRLSAESKETVDYLFDVASALGDRLGPVLFQTPPFLKKDVARLRDFLALLPPGQPGGLRVPPRDLAGRGGARGAAGAQRRPRVRRHRGVGRGGRPDRAHRRLGLPAPAPLRLRRRRPRRLGRSASAPSRGRRPTSSSSTRTTGRSAGRRSSASSPRCGEPGLSLEGEDQAGAHVALPEPRPGEDERGSSPFKQSEPPSPFTSV